MPPSPARGLQPSVRVAWTVIEPAQWSGFLAGFTGRHQGWLVRPGGTLARLGVRGTTPEPARIGVDGQIRGPSEAALEAALEATWRPLLDLRYEPEGAADQAQIVVTLGGPAGDPDQAAATLVLRIPAPRRVAVEQTADGGTRALAIASLAGRLTLRLRSAVAPERVNGPLR